MKLISCWMLLIYTIFLMNSYLLIILLNSVHVAKNRIDFT